jgi:hypothetical protein
VLRSLKKKRLSLLCFNFLSHAGFRLGLAPGSLWIVHIVFRQEARRDMSILPESLLLSNHHPSSSNQIDQQLDEKKGGGGGGDE